MLVTISDEQAVESLVNYSVNHRAAIASWALERFSTMTNPVERSSLAVEVFEKLIAAIEDLEMLLYAIRAYTADASTSFLSIYEDVYVSEGQVRSRAGETSALTLLGELGSLTDEQLRDGLGLPALDTYVGTVTSTTLSAAAAAAEYAKYLADLRNVIGRALATRTEPSVMGAYNKIKHGFVVMHHPAQGLHLLSDVTSSGPGVSQMECKLFNPTEAQLQRLVDTVKAIANTSRGLLQLRFQFGR